MENRVKNATPGSIIPSGCKSFHASTSTTGRTGQLLSDAGFITSKNIKQVLSIQKKREQSLSNKPNRLFGMILCDLNLITPVDLYSVLHENNKIYTMETSLVCNEKIPQKQIHIFKNEAARGIYSFFDLILKYKILCTSNLQQRIFELYHIPYRHVDRFNYDQTDKKELLELLDKNISFENHTVPMIKKNSSLIVGITRPQTLLFIRKLNFNIPHYRLIPVFIPLPHCKALYRKLYGVSTDKGFPLEEKKTIRYNSKSVKEQDLNKEPDIFFKFKTTLSDPDKEESLISDLYLKYEMLRQLSGEEKRPNRRAYFRSFIRERFKVLTASYCCEKLEILLTGEHGRVNISARPITRPINGTSCHAADLDFGRGLSYKIKNFDEI